LKPNFLAGVLQAARQKAHRWDIYSGLTCAAVQTPSARQQKVVEEPEPSIGRHVGVRLIAAGDAPPERPTEILQMFHLAVRQDRARQLVCVLSFLTS
jgi:hypothetical protein